MMILTYCNIFRKSDFRGQNCDKMIKSVHVHVKINASRRKNYYATCLTADAKNSGCRQFWKMHTQNSSVLKSKDSKITFSQNL